MSGSKLYLVDSSVPPLMPDGITEQQPVSRQSLLDAIAILEGPSLDPREIALTGDFYVSIDKAALFNPGQRPYIITKVVESGEKQEEAFGFARHIRFCDIPEFTMIEQAVVVCGVREVHCHVRLLTRNLIATDLE
jgi:hypothetical protein